MADCVGETSPELAKFRTQGKGLASPSSSENPQQDRRCLNSSKSPVEKTEGKLPNRLKRKLKQLNIELKRKGLKGIKPTKASMNTTREAQSQRGIQSRG